MSIRSLSKPDRTTIRKLGIALLALSLVAGAGCSGAILGSGGGGDSGLIDYVPEDQNVVMELNMAVLQDDTTNQLLQASEDDEASQEDLQQSLSEFEDQTGLDPAGFNAVMIYGQSNQMTSVDAASEEDVGILVETDWTAEEVTAAIESNESTSLVEQDYAESGVLYQVQSEGSDDQNSYLGIHGDGVFVFGTEGPVRSSLDITYADGNSVSGPLRDAYDDTRDGYAKFAMTMPQNAGTGSGMAAGMSRDVEALTGVYYTNDGTVGLEGQVVMTSADSATQLEQGVNMMLASQSGSQSAELAQHLSVSSSGNVVTFTYESDVQTLIEASDSA